MTEYLGGDVDRIVVIDSEEIDTAQPVLTGQVIGKEVVTAVQNDDAQLVVDGAYPEIEEAEPVELGDRLKAMWFEARLSDHEDSIPDSDDIEAASLPLPKTHTLQIEGPSQA